MRNIIEVYLALTSHRDMVYYIYVFTYHIDIANEIYVLTDDIF